HGLVFATVPNNSQMTGSFNNQLLLKHPIGNFSNCLSYLYKIVTHGLIEIFEKYFHKDNKTFTACSLEIFNILVKYIEYYYLTQYNFNSANFFMSNNPSSLSSIAAENLPVQNQIEAQSNSKFFNYYSHIRKEIFDFLLRIRSNPEGRVLLIDRVNRRKFIQSKYLMLNLCETKARFSEDFEQKNLLKCELDFGKILKMIEYCLDKEVDWHVITRLLAELPYVMQYEMDLIKISDFTYKLFTLLHKKDINVIRNKPENLSGQEYISKFYPLLASMVLYHSSFEKNSQENILQNLASGIHASRNLFCLEILTIAMTEMHETNANQCAELLLKLSQFSSSLAIAQPILELLSTISDFKKLHSVCATKEFIAVSATAIKYIDPFKFNPFIVLMAHYVLCAWFIKCKPESRKSYASFTSRGLYQEVIVQLDNKVNYREKKSPNKLPEQENLTNAQKRLSAVEPNQKNEPKSAQPENHGSSRAISDNLKQFYRDLVEITMDFMSNNMNYDSSYLNQSSSIHNSGEFMADRFSSIGSLPGNYNQ
ncbi:tuberin isoform X5, partial [Brachionus plicatilis]